MEDATFAGFREWAERRVGGKAVRAQRQGERRSGGRPAWFMDFDVSGSQLSCYARMERDAEQLVSRAFPLEREFRILEVLAAHGIRVPEVFGFCSDPAGILMACVPGDFDYTRLHPGSDRDALDRDFLSELARVHALPVDPFARAGISVPTTAEEVALSDLALWEDTYRLALRRPVPLVEFATRWLRRHVPAPPSVPSFIQGDTGPGQFLFDQGRVTAIIDWEFGHLGDPHLDLAQIRTRDFYNPGADMGQWIRTYTEVSGRAIEPATLRYYTVKSMLITPLALAGVVQNMVPSADHAEWFAQDVCYKRATAEALAEALEVPLDPPEPPTAAPGRSAEVVALLEEQLREEHRPALAGAYDRYRMDLGLRLLRHIANVDACGAVLVGQETEDLAALLGKRTQARTLDDAALMTCIAAEDRADDRALVRYLHRRAVRDETLWRGALGVGEGAVLQPIAF